MTPEQWQAVRPILESALELDPGSRASYLDGACADAFQRQEVESLLASHEQAGTQILAPGVAPSFDDGDEPHFASLTGTRIGPYEIVQEIAVGGMGAVYRAIRADGQYRQQVALKIVRADLGSAHSKARFRNERQILASLDHPGIAKILDGGTTDSGLPYLVMEFIDGMPVTEYCDQHKLSIDARLKLFRSICSAVHYAHQRLVIHRDIKPSNILVTADGAPKLLDFGIAKILDPGLLEQNVTLTGAALWLMTPEYASPEQLRGEPITTATDVYSLGLVLYELLTGRRAYCFSGRMPHEIAHVVLETDPEKPSTVIRHSENRREERANKVLLTEDLISSLRSDLPKKLWRRLSGDLDNIVLTAIRKEARERYSSVDRLSEDIHRHLDGVPVFARKDTFAYRASKFVSRHKVGVSLAAVTAIAVLAGLAATLYEAHVARVERARAEARFNDVRKLANSLIFQIHDSVQNLPGATPTRKLILDQALEYLDNLAKESAGDVSLQRELASAYTRVATLQGIASESNLGQGNEGLVSFGKALTIRDAIAKTDPNNSKDQLELAAAHRLMARMIATAGKSGASEQNEQALAITAQLLKVDAGDFDTLRERAVEFELAADMEDDPTAAIAGYRSSLSISQQQLKENPQDKRLQLGIALVSTKMGSQLAQLDSRDEALQVNQSALDALQTLAKDQTNIRYSRELAFAWAFRGQILLGNGNAPAAVAANRRALQIAEAMAKNDPQNVALQLDLAAYSSGEGIALVQRGKYRDGELSLGRAIRIYEEKFATNHADTEIPWLLAHNLIWMGEALTREGETSAGAASYRKSIEALESLKGSASNAAVQGDLAAAHLQLGEALAKMGQGRKASSQFQAALTIAEPLANANPPNHAALYTEADAYFGMGQLASAEITGSSAMSNQWHPQSTAACDSYRKSAEVWRRIPNAGAVSSSLKPCGSRTRVMQHLAACETARSLLKGGNSRQKMEKTN